MRSKQTDEMPKKAGAIGRCSALGWSSRIRFLIIIFHLHTLFSSLSAEASVSQSLYDGMRGWQSERASRPWKSHGGDAKKTQLNGFEPTDLEWICQLGCREEPAVGVVGEDLNTVTAKLLQKKHPLWHSAALDDRDRDCASFRIPPKYPQIWHGHSHGCWRSTHARIGLREKDKSSHHRSFLHLWVTNVQKIGLR